MQREIYNEGIAQIVKSFPDKPIDTELIWEYLKDLTDEQFIAGIKKVMSEKEAINRSDNIIAIVRKMALMPDLLEAGDAWGVVMKAVSRIGSYGVPVFKDKVIGRAVECLGWRNICLSETPGVERAHFLKIYEQLKNRKEKDSINLIQDIKKIGYDFTEKIDIQPSIEDRARLKAITANIGKEKVGG